MILIVCALLAAAGKPPAAGGERSAYVLRIDGRDTYFDLGRGAGAGAGARVRVFRLVSAVNPVTQATVADRFLVTEIEIAEAGEVLSRAQPPPEVARLIKVGDFVELAAPAVAAAPPLRELHQPAECPAPLPVDPEAVGLKEAFLKAQELPVLERIAYWQRWAGEHPSWAVSRSVKREVEALAPTGRQPAVTAALAPEPPKPAEPEKPAVSAPAHAQTGDPFEVVLDFADKPPRAAVLNYRSRGDTLYRTVSFEADEARYWRARLPEGAVSAPGLDYYVGLVDAVGDERPVAGDGTQPTAVDVVRPPGADLAERKQRSRASLWIDYANWNSKQPDDYHYNLEGEFLYRVLRGLHSVRMGFGIYQGKGESLDAEKAGLPPADVGYHYGFTELEFQPAEMIGLRLKALTGVDRNGFNTGIEGKIRIGEENGTNLVLASGFTGGIGNKNEITLTWDRVTGWPMAGTVIVTNEPVEANYGVRFIYSIGRNFDSFLDLSLRLSYELRSIEHGGFGIGIADSFHW